MVKSLDSLKVKRRTQPKTPAPKTIGKMKTKTTKKEKRKG